MNIVILSSLFYLPTTLWMTLCYADFQLKFFEKAFNIWIQVNKQFSFTNYMGVGEMEHCYVFSTDEIQDRYGPIFWFSLS